MAKTRSITNFFTEANYEHETWIGLSQICSKICSKCFQEFPKNFTYYASQCSYYAWIMLLSCQKFLVLSWKIQSNDCSIRVFHYKVTVLLESIDQSGANCNAFECFFLQFEYFNDCSIKEYRSILDESTSVFWNIYLLY